MRLGLPNVIVSELIYVMNFCRRMCTLGLLTGTLISLADCANRLDTATTGYGLTGVATNSLLKEGRDFEAYGKGSIWLILSRPNPWPTQEARQVTSLAHYEGEGVLSETRTFRALDRYRSIVESNSVPTLRDSSAFTPLLVDGRPGLRLPRRQQRRL